MAKKVAGRIPVSWALWTRPQVGQWAESPDCGVLPLKHMRNNNSCGRAEGKIHLCGHHAVLVR